VTPSFEAAGEEELGHHHRRSTGAPAVTSVCREAEQEQSSSPPSAKAADMADTKRQSVASGKTNNTNAGAKGAVSTAELSRALGSTYVYTILP
jgi:hypothetical protein